MAYVLGLDIGTSYTAAAIFRLDEHAIERPQPLRLGSRRDAVPSVVFLPDEGPALIGETAERRGLSHPDQVIREFKRRVGDPVPIVVGSRHVSAEDLIGAMATWVVARAAEVEGELPAAVALAHPAGWGDYKLGLVRAALERAGLPEVAFVAEPEAAARRTETSKVPPPRSYTAIVVPGSPPCWLT